MGQPFPAPTFGHAADAFVIAHAAPGAWSKGTAVKYRQTLIALGGRLDGATRSPLATCARSQRERGCPTGGPLSRSSSRLARWPTPAHVTKS